jgi:pseudouridine synthase
MPDLERLHKIIAAAGITSRRKAEEMIRQGRVSLNGKIVNSLGTKADPLRDHVKVDGKLIRPPVKKIYILLNKPAGVICAVSDPQGRRKVTDLVTAKGKIFPVGRLDYNSEGLILLTNDGEFSNTVASAGKRLPKVYDVKVRALPDEGDLRRLREGFCLPDGTKLARTKVKLMRRGSNSWCEVTLTEGKNRQIRRMFAAIGHPVVKLRRRRIGFLTDRGLPLGGSRHLTPREVARIHGIEGKHKNRPTQNGTITRADGR